ncbi:MAG: M15 family metallopeptidase [Cellulosilyticaceae bacterium]
MSTAQCRDPKKLHPIVCEKAIAALNECNQKGLNMAFTETLRTVERQDFLYEQGRTRPGKVVTNAKGSSMSSYHQWGLAVDIHHNVNGNLYPADKMQQAAAIFKKYGFEWGGDWKDFKDTPHLQMTFGLSIADLKAGKKPPAVSQKKTYTVTIEEIQVCVDGKVVMMEAVNINGSNYSKMRDMACQRLGVDYGNVPGYKDKMPIITIR